MVDDFDVPLDNITYVSEEPADYKRLELEKYNSLIGLLSTVHTLLEDDDPYRMEGIVAKIEKGQDGIYATLDEVILSVHEIDTGAFSSVEEYIKGMKGTQLVFTAKDIDTGQKVKLEGVLRDGVKDEELDCYHIIMDNVQVPVEDIVSTQKVDLVSTEQQLLRQILETLRSLDSKLSTESSEPEDNIETEETEASDRADMEGDAGENSSVEQQDEAEETGGSGL